MKNINHPVRAFIRQQNEALEIEPIDIPLPGLPTQLDGFSIAIVSDLHIHRPNAFHDKILSTVRSLQPDCILIPGDSMDSTTELVAWLEPFFSRLSTIAPSVAVLGNNDCLRGRIFSLRDMYRRAGVTLLENETRLLNARGAPLRITGLLDPTATRRGIAPDYRAHDKREYVPLNHTLPPQKDERTQGVQLPSILLLHQPQLARHYASLGPSLIIAGHAHGGQFRLRNGQGLYAPGQGLFPRLTSGLYTVNNTHMIVSRGLGNHELPLRLNNRPHLPVAVLRQG